MLAVKAVDGGWLILIFVIRFAAIAVPGNLLQTDPDSYLKLANAWVESGTYGLIDDAGMPHATAYRPPLYPALLAATIWCSGSASLWGIAAVHAALATLSASLLLSIGRALHVRHALAAVLLLSVDPLLIRQSQLIMTETMATTVGLFSWWLMVCEEKWRDNASSTSRPNLFKWTLHLLTGLSFGIATLTRPTAIVWFALIVAYYLLRQSPSRAVMIRQAAWFCLGFTIALTPWVARNREQFDKPIWATTHGGYTLLLANNPILYDHFEQGSVSRNWDEDLFHRLWARRKDHDPYAADFWNVDNDKPTSAPTDLDLKQRSPETLQIHFGQQHREVAEDELAQSIALKTIRQRPWVMGWSMVVRIGWLWTPLPNPRPDSWIKWPITLWYVVLYGLALRGTWQLGRKNFSARWWCGWLLLISLTLVHSVYWSNMRMRAPALPLLYLLAAYGVESWLTNVLWLNPKAPSDSGKN